MTPSTWRTCGRPQVPVWAGPDYAGPVTRVVIAWKDRDRHDLTPALGAGLARCVQAATAAARRGGGLRGRDPVVLVPVPSSASASRRRGGDVTAALAGDAARRLRRSGQEASVCTALQVGRPVRDQSGLSAGQRAANVSGAFTVRTQVGRILLPFPVVIVDDVTTTGASLAEAIRATTQVGGRVVAAATVCATPQRFPAHG